MPYPSSSLGKTCFSGALVLLIAVRGLASAPTRNFSHYIFSESHNSLSYALYYRDTVQEHPASGFIRRTANGDLVITVPQAHSGQYKIRFFDERKTMLFEIRQIRDPLLIVEKFNFEHAGQFQYELYRDAILVEKSSFIIRKE